MFYFILFILSYQFLEYGIFTNKEFKKGEFLLQYMGEILSRQEGERRLEELDSSLGSYLFFFKDVW